MGLPPHSVLLFCSGELPFSRGICPLNFVSIFAAGSSPGSWCNFPADRGCTALVRSSLKKSPSVDLPQRAFPFGGKAGRSFSHVKVTGRESDAEAMFSRLWNGTRQVPDVCPGRAPPPTGDFVPEKDTWVLAADKRFLFTPSERFLFTRFCSFLPAYPRAVCCNQRSNKKIRPRRFRAFARHRICKF